MNNNDISNLAVFIEKVGEAFPKLRWLSMLKNAACPNFFNGGTPKQYRDYRAFVAARLPRLKELDSSPISAEERADGDRLYGSSAPPIPLAVAAPPERPLHPVIPPRLAKPVPPLPSPNAPAVSSEPVPSLPELSSIDVARPSGPTSPTAGASPPPPPPPRRSQESVLVVAAPKLPAVAALRELEPADDEFAEALPPAPPPEPPAEDDEFHDAEGTA